MLNTFDSIFKEKIELEVNQWTENRSKESHNSLKFELFNLNDQIKRLNTKSAPGPDRIHNLFIINAHDDFKNLVLELLNLSYHH